MISKVNSLHLTVETSQSLSTIVIKIYDWFGLAYTCNSEADKFIKFLPSRQYSLHDLESQFVAFDRANTTTSGHKSHQILWPVRGLAHTCNWGGRQIDKITHSPNIRYMIPKVDSLNLTEDNCYLFIVIFYYRKDNQNHYTGVFYIFAQKKCVQTCASEKRNCGCVMYILEYEFWSRVCAKIFRDQSYSRVFPWVWLALRLINILFVFFLSTTIFSADSDKIPRNREISRCDSSLK